MSGDLQSNKRYYAELFSRTGKFGDIKGGNYIDINSSGKMSFGGKSSASGIILGVGTNLLPLITTVADAKFVELRVKSNATSGDNRLAYLRYELGSTGGGECIRALTKLSGVVGTARGAQISLDIDTTGSVTGLGIGLDGQLLVNDALPANGTYYAAQAEMYMVASSSMAAVTTHAIFSITANGDATAAATVKNAIAFNGAEGTGNMIYNNNSTGAAESNGSIRILVNEGAGLVARYLRYWDAENS